MNSQLLERKQLRTSGAQNTRAKERHREDEHCQDKLKTQARIEAVGENTESACEAAPAEGQESIQKLIKQIIRDLPSGSSHLADEDLTEIIFDAEIDGVQYLLIRSRTATLQSQVLLSPREQEIARMVAKGYPNKTIAAVLEISSWTVNTYLRRIFSKFGVTSRAAMVAQLLEQGLFQENPILHKSSCPLRKEINR
jgi:DNA-binding CsgD family transcriptional regulator